MEQTRHAHPHLTRLTTAMLVALCLSFQAAPGIAAPAPGTVPSHGAAAPRAPRPVDRVFDLRSLSAPQRAVVQQVLVSFDFDWRLLSLSDLGDRRKRILVEVADISSWSAVGLAWPGPIGKIQIDDQVHDLGWFQDVFIHEVAHIVDFFYLKPTGLRDDIEALYGIQDWTDLSHSFISAFVRAFSSIDAQQDRLPTSLDTDLRLLMGGKGEPPPKSISLSQEHRAFMSLDRHTTGLATGATS